MGYFISYAHFLFKDEAEASKSKVVEMEERARGAEEEKEQLQSQVHKLETDYDVMVEKLITVGAVNESSKYERNSLDMLTKQKRIFSFDIFGFQF